MGKITIYHGSNVEVAHPRILQNGFYKDFGYGFYCTKLFKQARRWAMTKKGDTVVNSYIYTPDTSLEILSFSEMTEEWLDFVVHQILFCNDNALRTLQFEGSEHYDK